MQSQVPSVLKSGVQDISRSGVDHTQSMANFEKQFFNISEKYDGHFEHIKRNLDRSLNLGEENDESSLSGIDQK